MEAASASPPKSNHARPSRGGPTRPVEWLRLSVRGKLLCVGGGGSSHFSRLLLRRGGGSPIAARSAAATTATAPTATDATAAATTSPNRVHGTVRDVQPGVTAQNPRRGNTTTDAAVWVSAALPPTEHVRRLDGRPSGEYLVFWATTFGGGDGDGGGCGSVRCRCGTTPTASPIRAGSPAAGATRPRRPPTPLSSPR